MEVTPGEGMDRLNSVRYYLLKGHCLLQPLTFSGPLRLLVVSEHCSVSETRLSQAPAHLTHIKVRTKHSVTVVCNGEFKKQKRNLLAKLIFFKKCPLRLPPPSRFHNGMHTTVRILTYVFSQYQDLLSLELNESQY